MTLAYDYPLWEVFWTIVAVFLFIAWCMAVFGLLSDVFRSDDMSGAAKVGWVVLLLLFPILGVVIYLIVRGDRLGQHARDTVSRQDAAYMSYVNRGR
jgi:hypothetical protein